MGARKMINAPYDKEFIFRDGSRAKNIPELAERVIRLSDAEFGSFVNKDKNDFANWIEFVLEEKSLSSKLRMTYSKAETLSLLLTHIMNFSSDMQKSVSSNLAASGNNSASYATANDSTDSIDSTAATATTDTDTNKNPVADTHNSVAVNENISEHSMNSDASSHASAQDTDKTLHSAKPLAGRNWFKRDWFRKNNHHERTDTALPDTLSTRNNPQDTNIPSHATAAYNNPNHDGFAHENNHNHFTYTSEHDKEHGHDKLHDRDHDKAHDKEHDKNSGQQKNDAQQKNEEKHAANAAAKRWFALFRMHKIFSEGHSNIHGGHISPEDKLGNQVKENFSENLLWVLLYGLLIGLILILVIYKFVFNY